MGGSLTSPSKKRAPGASVYLESSSGSAVEAARAPSSSSLTLALSPTGESTKRRAGQAPGPASRRTFFRVGDRVFVKCRRTGTVKFFGFIGPADKPIVGVELDSPTGDTDGTVDGVQYFRCRPGFGTFVAFADAAPWTPEVPPAIKIQAVARGFQARLFAASKLNWFIYNQLDNDDEKLHIIRSKLLEITPVTSPTPAFERSASLPSLPPEEGAVFASTPLMLRSMTNPREGSSFLVSLGMRVTGGEARKLDAFPVEVSYTGPRLTWPLTQDQVKDMIARFTKGEVLHFKFVMQVLAEFRSLERASARNVTRLTVPSGGQLTVVGDLHGHFKDLVHIFELNGLPSASNWYLFNGDFEDRGPQGIEVLMTLFCWKILYPDFVWLNRGNHEDKSQNQHYNRGRNGCWGFLEEIFFKYADLASYCNKLYNAFECCFELLPIATVVNDVVLVIHGGLCRHPSVTIDHIEAIKRTRPIPLVRHSDLFEDALFEDLMWSDPSDVPGYSDSSRNAGIMFGPDITKKFLEENKLKLIIRSHECVDEGIQWQRGANLVTVFSASNYNGYPNKGAIIMLSDNLTMTHSSYDVSSTPVTLRNRLLLHKRHIVEMLQDKICTSKSELYLRFTQADVERLGTLSRRKWGQCMASVLDLENLPWMSLANTIAVLDSDGRVHYSSFLDRYRVIMAGNQPWQEEVVQQVSLRLFRACSDLSQAYKQFDLNNDGTIEYSEFVTTLRKLDIGLTESQIYELMRSLDADSSSTLDFGEFASRFEVVFSAKDIRPRSTELVHPTHSSGSQSVVGTPCSDDAPVVAAVAVLPPLTPTASDVWAHKELAEIGSVLFRAECGTKEVFQEFDLDLDGQLTLEEFTQCLETLMPARYTPGQVKQLFDVVDVNLSGQLDYDEFLSALRINIRPSSGGVALSDSWRAVVIEHVTSVLYSFSSELQALFTTRDVDGSGRIGLDVFRQALSALSARSPHLLTPAQVDDILCYLESFGSGTLDYRSFLAGMSVVDALA